MTERDVIPQSSFLSVKRNNLIIDYQYFNINKMPNKLSRSIKVGLSITHNSTPIPHSSFLIPHDV